RACMKWHETLAGTASAATIHRAAADGWRLRYKELSMTIAMTDFARRRLFPRDGRRNGIRDCTADQFVEHRSQHEPSRVLDGYAPFCKLPVHENWTSTRATAVAITDANRHLLRSAYEARSREELPVLNRWFEGVEPPV